MVTKASKVLNTETSERGLRDSHKEIIGVHSILDVLRRLGKATALVDCSQGSWKPSRIFRALIDVLAPESARVDEQALFQPLLAQRAQVLASFRRRPS